MTHGPCLTHTFGLSEIRKRGERPSLRSRWQNLSNGALDATIGEKREGMYDSFINHHESELEPRPNWLGLLVCVSPYRDAQCASVL